MKGTHHHHHVATFGASVILSTVAVFVVTPSAASALAAGSAGAILVVSPLAPAGPGTRRPRPKVRVAASSTSRRAAVDLSDGPVGPVAHAVKALRRAVGTVLRTAMAYLGLSRRSRLLDATLVRPQA